MFQGIILLHCQPCLWEADPTRSQALNGLLAFDVLATVPAKATITSAQLLVYESGKGSGGVLTLETHRVTRAWIEAQVSALKATTTKSWGTVGGDFAATVVSTADICNGGNVWHTWDVTALVQEWVDGISPDYGLILIQPAGGSAPTQAKYNSRGTSPNGPRLLVTCQ